MCLFRTLLFIFFGCTSIFRRRAHTYLFTVNLLAVRTRPVNKLSRADDKKGCTPPPKKSRLTKRGTLLLVDRELYDVHVVVGINPTAQQDVCPSTVHYSSYIHHHCIRTAKRLLSKKPNVRTGNISDLRTASERVFHPRRAS